MASFAASKTAGLTARAGLNAKLKVSTELGALWGACNAVSAALRPAEQRALYARAGAAAADGLTETVPELDKAPEELAQTVRERLDFRPRLSPAQVAAVLCLPAVACAIIWACLRPPAPSLQFAAVVAAVYGLGIVACRTFLLERQYQELAREEHELAEADSRFLSVDEVCVHYKAAPAPVAWAEAGNEQAQRPLLALGLLHGFGANAFSWSFVDRQLAERLRAQVTAHDMPGFGLTQRHADLDKYSLQFNGHIARRVMDHELGAAAGERQQRVLRVLVGHSLGAAGAAAEAIANPEGLAGLVLVAPAILAAPLGKRGSGSLEGDPGGAGAPDSPAASAASLDSAASGAALQADHARGRDGGAATAAPTAGSRWRAAVRLAAAAGVAAAAAATRAFLWLLQPLLVLALRGAVRSRAFWERGLASAWYERTGVTAALVDAYRTPQLVRGWERGLLRFLMARVSGGDGLLSALRSGGLEPERGGQAAELARIVAKHNIQVLVVHGEADALVPAWNSRRLAAGLPGARLIELDRCGHMPMEEAPARFMGALADFVAALQAEAD
ncbi:hypothetical protein WJX81_003847 [Elliptochloris bilobata]|uniref:AB hydrolase-1 domain-containing protein n=1 Tax=Elliptochloris bilobata TaxID=381761 RepID=A0AAW1RMW5_9CHLO